jgi:hypothetical protein
MSKLYITEYTTISCLPGATSGQVPFEPPLIEQVVDFTGGPVTSNPFQPGTRMIRLHADATCSVLVGLAPSVSTGSGRMATNQTEYRGVPEGQSFKVAVVGNV